MASPDDDRELYTVVCNAQEQFSIWPAGKSIPPGWRETGVRGGKVECLAHIATVWIDMRPLRLREAASGPHDHAD